jgi:hypothetical protein
VTLVAAVGSFRRTVVFNHAAFNAGDVLFSGAMFSGGMVKFRRNNAWTRQPEFDSLSRPHRTEPCCSRRPLLISRPTEDAVACFAVSTPPFRDLRALRYDPPGYAKQGPRRTTFQSALEQCEQFLLAARHVGYATRAVQLFYALSQAARAMVAASSRIGNQAWRVTGHGLTANTNVASVADVAVTAKGAGLFAKAAEAMGLEPLPPGEPVTLGVLWQLLPEAVFVPLAPDQLYPVLCFLPSSLAEPVVFSEAEIAWIPRRVHHLYMADPVGLKEHLNRYPALRGCELKLKQLGPNRIGWQAAGPGLTVRVRWRSGDPPLPDDSNTLSDLGVFSYRTVEDLMITPAVGSMSTGLHPILGLWAVLLALSSLARYEPATWSKLIDIDRSSEANAIEHLLDEAIGSLPTVIVHLLTSS